MSKGICKISSALIVVGLAIFIACIADSYHKVNKDYVFYFGIEVTLIDLFRA